MSDGEVEACRELTISQPALRQELLALAREDQDARRAWLSDPAGVEDQLTAVDRKATARMKEIVSLHDWPGRSSVGADGAWAAWLLVQHADHDRPFQKLCLPKLEQAVLRGEAEASHHAYLFDRIAVAENRPQRYGTQFDDQREPHPIEDEERVDERRLSVGLPTLAEYRRHMWKTYGPPDGSQR